jgi:hypothetical protein
MSIKDKQNDLMAWFSVVDVAEGQKKNPKDYEKAAGRYKDLKLFPVNTDAFRIMARSIPLVYPPNVKLLYE